MSRLTPHGTTDPVSRDQIHKCERGQNIHFPCSADHEEDICMVITYSKSKDQPGKVANPARGQLDRENEYFPVLVRA